MQVFENLKAALASAGARFQDVVKLNNYIIDKAQAICRCSAQVRDQYPHSQPTSRPSTTIAVAGLRPSEEWRLLETEAVAVLPAKAAAKPAKSKAAGARGRASKVKARRRKRK